MPETPTGGPSPSLCPNCGTRAEDAFCPGCGQRQGQEVLSVRFWLAQVVEAYLTVDGRVPRSVGALLFRPGFLTKEWHEGRRIRYSSPFYLCLWAAVLFVAGIFFGFDAAVQWSWGETRYDLPVRALPLFLVAAVPFFAQVVSLMEWGTDRTFVEHLVFATHLQAFLFVALTPVVLHSELEVLRRPWEELVLAGLTAYMVLYVILAIRRVYGGGWLRAVGGAMILGLGYTVVVPVAAALVTFVLVGVVAALGWALGLVLPVS